MINYPVSFDEQNAIVGTLESIDRKLVVNEQLNDNLQQQLTAIYKSWYQDFSLVNDTELVETAYGTGFLRVALCIAWRFVPEYFRYTQI